MPTPESETPPVAAHGGETPIIDLSRWRRGGAARRDLVRAVGQACEDSGFLLIVNHSIPASTLAAVDKATRAFFALPRAAKRELAPDPADPLGRGYTLGDTADELDAAPPAAAALASGGGVVVEAGHQESFTINRLGEPSLARPQPGVNPVWYTPNPWPPLPGFREAYLAFYAEADRLALEIMRVLAAALGLDEDWFAAKFDQHTASLSANFYPPRGTALGLRLRKGEHTDWGAVTVLHRAGTGGGLEVFDRAGQWREIPAVPGALVINLGDLMARWTNDRWASTVHRVVYPGGRDAEQERYSVAFFHQPSRDALIECIPTCTVLGRSARYPAVAFGDYLAGKARRAYMQRKLGHRPAGPPAARRA
jgi:isopenicillin N synthase-like dioxygenase